MKSQFQFLTLALLAGVMLPSLRCQDLPTPQNPAALLKELDQIANGSQTLEQKRRTDAISRIQSASSSGTSSVELYLNALDATKYADKHQEFLDWKQKNQETFRHPSLQNAAQLQLRYLLLALQRSEQRDALAQVPDSLSYLNSLSGLHFLEEPYSPQAQQKGAKPQPASSDQVLPEAATLIKQPLASSAVVEWFRIKDLLPNGKDFEGSPGNYSGILDKNVKTPLRKNKDPRLPGVWDMQITTESAVISATKSQQKLETFQTTRLPELIFGKLKDTAEIGQPNRAFTEMMKLIKSYSANPSVQDWIDTAKGLLTNQSATPAPLQQSSATGGDSAMPSPSPTGTNTPVIP